MTAQLKAKDAELTECARQLAALKLELEAAVELAAKANEHEAELSARVDSLKCQLKALDDELLRSQHAVRENFEQAREQRQLRACLDAQLKEKLVTVRTLESEKSASDAAFNELKIEAEIQCEELKAQVSPRLRGQCLKKSSKTKANSLCSLYCRQR